MDTDGGKTLAGTHDRAVIQVATNLKKLNACRHARFVFQQAACGLVAAAVGRAIAEHSDHRDQEAANERETHRIASAPADGQVCETPRRLASSTRANRQLSKPHTTAASKAGQ